jgi:hypothetical protein
VLLGTFPGFCTILLVTFGVSVPFTGHFKGSIKTTKLCIKKRREDLLPWSVVGPQLNPIQGQYEDA